MKKLNASTINQSAIFKMRLFTSSAILTVLLFFTQFSFGQVFYSQNTGDFDNPIHWNSLPGGGGVAPAMGDFTSGTASFVVQSPHIITLDAAPAINNLTIENGGTLQLANQNATINGTTSINGILADNADGGHIIFGGAVNVANTGNFQVGNTTTFEFRNGIMATGPVRLDGTGNKFFTTNNQTINLGSPLVVGIPDNRTRIQPIEINGGITVTNHGHLLTDSPTGTGTFTNAATGVLSVTAAAPFSAPGVTFNLANAGNTVIYNATGGDQDVRPLTYHHLRASIRNDAAANRSIRLTGATAIQGNLTIESAHATNLVIFRALNHDITVSGNTLIRARGQFTDNQDAGVNTFHGLVTVEPDGRLDALNTATPGNMNFRGGIINNGASFQLLSARFSNNPQTITPTTAITFAAGSVVEITGPTTLAAGVPLTFQTLNITGGSLDITTPSATTVTTTLAVTGTGSLLGGSGNLDINGALTLNTTGTFRASSGTTFLAGNFTYTAGTFQHHNGTFTYDGGGQTVAALTYWNLSMINGSNKTAAGPITVEQDILIGATNTTFNPGNFTHTVSGNWTEAGGSAGMPNTGNSTIVFIGSNESIVNSNGGGVNFHNLQLGSGKTLTLNQADNFSLNGQLIIPDCNGGAVTLQGSAPNTTINIGANTKLNVSGAVFNVGNITVQPGSSQINIYSGVNMGNNQRVFFAGDASLDPRALFWVGGRIAGGTGNWNDCANWSATSGGAGGQVPPLSNENVTFDANSFNGTGPAIVTITPGATANDFTWTAGVTNNPVLALGANHLDLFGNLVLQTPAANWDITATTGEIRMRATSGTRTLTTTGEPIPALRFNGTGGTWTLSDNLTVDNAITVQNGHLNNSGNRAVNTGTLAVETGGNFSGGNATLTVTGASVTFADAATTNLINTTFTFTTAATRTLTLSNTARTIGTLNVQNGILTLANSTAPSQTLNTVTLTASTTLTNNITTGSAIGALNGAGSITFNGTGTSSVTGVVNLTAGTVTIAGSGADVRFTGTANNTFNHIALTNPATLRFTNAGTDNIASISLAAAAVSGTTAIRFSNTGSAAVGNMDFGPIDCAVTSYTAANRPLVTGNAGIAPVSFTTAQSWTAIRVQNLNVTSTNLNVSGTPTASYNLGGNTGITFNNVLRTFFWVRNGGNGTGNWTYATLPTAGTGGWSFTSGGVVVNCNPTIEDRVVFDANSFGAAAQVVTVNTTTARAGDLAFTGVTNNPQLNITAGNTLTVGGSLNITSAITTAGTGTLAFTAATRNSAVAETIRTNGVTIAPNITFDATNPAANQWQLVDALTSTGNLTVIDGAFLSNNQSVTAGTFLASGTGTRTLNLGSSAVTITGTGTALNWTGTGLTLTPTTGTMTFSNNAGTALTVNWPDQTAFTFGPVTISGTTTKTVTSNDGGRNHSFGTLTIAQSNTFNENGAGNNTFASISAGNSVTYHANGPATYTGAISFGNNGTFNANQPATYNGTLTFGTGAAVNLTNVTHTFAAGAHITIGGGNLTLTGPATGSTFPNNFTLTNVTANMGGAHTYSGNWSLTGGTATFPGNNTFSGNIGGTGNIVFSGTGTSTVSGQVNLTGGTFTVSGNGAIANFTGTANNVFNNFSVTNPATVAFSNAGSETFANVTLGAGAGYTWRFSAGQTTTVTGIFATPQCITATNNITVNTNIPGTHANVNFTNPQGWFSVNVRDLNVTNARLIVNYATDAGNNIGNIQLNTGVGTPNVTYYWVGNTGNWNVAANWSFTSGGPGGACVPTDNDDVIFDVNSFTANNRTVTVTAGAACRSIFWTADQNDTGIVLALGSNNLDVHGSIDFQTPNDRWDITGTVGTNNQGEIRMRATTTGWTIRTNGEPIPTLRFNGTGGEWTLVDDLYVDRNTSTTAPHTGGTGHIFLQAGHFRTNGKNIWAGFLNGRRDLSGTNFNTTRRLSIETIGAEATAIVLNGTNSGSGFPNNEQHRVLDFLQAAGTFTYDTPGAGTSITFTNPNGYLDIRVGNNGAGRAMEMPDFVFDGARDIDIHCEGNNGIPSTNRVTFRNITRTSATNTTYQIFINGNSPKTFGNINLGPNLTNGGGSNAIQGNNNAANPNIFNGTISFGNNVDAGGNAFRFEGFNTFNADLNFGENNRIQFGNAAGLIQTFSAGVDITFGDNNTPARTINFNGPAQFATNTQMITTGEGVRLFFDQGNTLSDLSLGRSSTLTFTNGNSTIDDLILSDFNIVELPAGFTTTITGNITAATGCDTWNFIKSHITSNQTTLTLTSPSVLQNTILQDINVPAGSAMLYIYEGVDGGNNLTVDKTTTTPSTYPAIPSGTPIPNTTIWMPSGRDPQALFWVNNGPDYNWSSPSNWSTDPASTRVGGSCIPNPTDIVVFDQHSFAGTESVNIDLLAVYAKDMIWGTVNTIPTGGFPAYAVSRTGDLPAGKAGGLQSSLGDVATVFLFGNLVFDGTSNNTFTGTFQFVASSPSTITSNGQSFRGPIQFNSTTGQWQLTDNLDVNGGQNGNITITYGELDVSNDGGVSSFNINLEGSWNIANPHPDAVFLAREGTVTFDGTANNYHQTMVTRSTGPTINAFYNLALNRATGNNGNRTLRILNNAVYINHNLNLNSGWLFDSDGGNAGPFQIHGNTTGTMTMTDNASLSLGDNNGGDDAPTTFPTGYTAANINLSNGSTVYYRQRGTQTVSGVPVYGNLTLHNANNTLRIRNLDQPMTVNGILLIDDAIQFNDNGFQITAGVNAILRMQDNDNGVDGGRFVIGNNVNATTMPAFSSFDIMAGADGSIDCEVVYNAGSDATNLPQVIKGLSGIGNNAYARLTLTNPDGTSPTLVAKILDAITTVRGALAINNLNDLQDNGFQITHATGRDFTMGENSVLTLGDNISASLFPINTSSGNINMDATSTVIYHAGNALTQTVRRLSSATANQNYGHLIIRNSSGTPALLNTVKEIGTEVTADGTNQLTVRGNLTVESFNDFQDNGYQIRRFSAGGLLTVQDDAILTLGNNLTANARLGRTQLPLNFPRVNTTNISLALNSTVIYNAGDAVAPDEGGGAPNPANNQIVAGNTTGDGLVYGHLILKNGNGAAAAHAHKFAGGRIDVRGNLTIENFALFGDSGWQITGSTTPGNGITLNGNGILELGMWNGFYNDVAGTTGGGWYGSFGNNSGGPMNTRPSVFPVNLNLTGKYTFSPASTVRYIAHGHQRVTGDMAYQNLELLNFNGCGGAYNCARYRDLVNGPITINGNLLIDDNIWFRDNSHQISFTGVASTLTMNPNRSKLILGGTLPNAASPGGWNAVPDAPAGDYHQNWNATEAPTAILGDATIATIFPTGIVNLNLDANSFVIYNASVDQPIAALNSAIPAAQYGHLWLTKGQDPPAAPMVSKTLEGPATVRNSIWVYGQNDLVDNGHQLTHSATGAFRMEANTQATFGNGALASTFPLNTVNANVNLNANSIIIYRATANQLVRRLSSNNHAANPERNYANLIVRNNSVKSLDNSAVSATDFPNDLYVRGKLTLDHSTLALNDQQLTLAGTFERVNDLASEVLRGGNISDLRILGTGNLAEGALAKNALFFDMTTPGTTNQVRRFHLDRTGAGLATLGTDFATGTNPGFNGEIRLLNGEFALNGKHWTINTNNPANFQNNTTSSITGDFDAIVTINGSGNFNSGDAATGRLRFTTGSNHLRRLSVNRQFAGDDNVWIGTDLTLGDPAVDPSTVATFPVNTTSAGLELSAGDLILPSGITLSLNANHWRGTGRIAPQNPGANMNIANAFDASDATLQPFVFDHNGLSHMLANFTLNTNDPVTMGSDLVVTSNLNLQHPNALLILPTVANFAAQNPINIVEGPRVLHLNGTLSGPGALRGSYESRLFIGGTGDLVGDLKFENNTDANRLERLTINRTAGGIVTLDDSNDLVVGSHDLNSDNTLNAGELSGMLSMQAGTFELNGRTLTLNSRQGQYFRSNGFFRGSPTSNLILNGPGNLGGQLHFTGTFADGGQVLNNLVVNRSRDNTDLLDNSQVTNVLVQMGTNLRVDGDLYLQRGSLVLSTNTGHIFNINGTLTRADANPALRYVYTEGGLIRGGDNANLTIGNGNNSMVRIYLDDSNFGRRVLRNLRIERVTPVPGEPIVAMRSEVRVNSELHLAANTVFEIAVNKTDIQASQDGDGGYKGLLMFGTITGTGLFYGTYSSDLYIGRDGNIGTLNFVPGHNRLRALIFESGNSTNAATAVTLGSDLVVGSPVGTSGAVFQELNGRMNFQRRGNLILNGHTLTFNSRNAQVAVHPHTGLTMSDDGRISGDVNASIIFQGSGNLGTPTNGAIVFANGARTLRNLTIDRTLAGDNDLALLGTDLTMHTTGTLALNNGSLGINGNLLTVNGIHTNTTGRFVGSNTSRMLIGGAGAFAPLVFNQVTNANRTLGDLEITRTSQAIQLATGNDLILGISGSADGLDLNAANAILDLNGNRLIINGNLAERAGRIKGGTTSNLTLGGAGNLTGTLKFGPLAEDRLLRNLTLDRNGLVTLGTALQLTGVNALTLSNGYLVTTDANLLTLDAIATVEGSDDEAAPANGAFGYSGGSDASHVMGPVEKIFDGPLNPKAFRYPVGNGTRLREAGLTDISEASRFKVTYQGSSPTQAGRLVDPGGNLRHISALEWWNVARTSGGTTAAKVILHWDEFSDVANDPSYWPKLRVSHFNSGANHWESIGDTVVIGHDPLPGGKGYIISSVQASDFSPFTLGSESIFNLLPIDLVSFRGWYDKEEGAVLRWETSREVDNAGFILKRAIGQATDFEVIAHHETHAALRPRAARNGVSLYNWIDRNGLEPGEVHYYLLEQQDKDGNIRTVGMVAVAVTSAAKFYPIYPNPVKTVTHLSFSIDRDGPVKIEVVDMNGRVLQTVVNGSHTKGFHRYVYNSEKLQSGMYLIRFTAGGHQETQKMSVVH